MTNDLPTFKAAWRQLFTTLDTANMRLIYYFTLLTSFLSLNAAAASFIALQRPRTKTSNLHKKLVHHHVNQPLSLPSSYPKSKLYLASSTTDTIVSGTTLILSSTTGILFEKYISNGGGGHVITLLTSALLSNLSQVLSSIPIRIPTNHYLYDCCWGIFLPASLVFALLSSSPSSSAMPNTSQNSTQTNSYSESNNSKAILKNTIQGMTIPFILGSIGSILGCISSYHFVSMPYNTRDISALLAGCLCASYIGGTVNFFATANILKNRMNDVDLGSAFGSMSSADLIVMAVYFGMLKTVSRSNWLHKLFPSKVSRDDDEEEEDESTEQSSNIYQQQSITSSIIASSIALSSVLLVTKLEQKVTSTFGIPGTMCAFLAILGLTYQRLIHVTITSHQEWKPGAKPLSSSTNFISSLQGISKVAPTLSNICFYLLFAAVGTAADLSSAIVGGPSALVFASLALVVHSVTVVCITWISMRLLNSGKFKLGWPSSSWEEVLTASNAAIGGPSTASAFAVGLIPSDKSEDDVTNDKRSQYRSALVIGATFWGVFGYAIATSEYETLNLSSFVRLKLLYHLLNHSTLVCC